VAASPRSPASGSTRGPSARPDGVRPERRNTLAVGVANGIVLLWDNENPRHSPTGRPAITGPDGIIHALAYSPDRSFLAGGAGIGQTWIWRVTVRGICQHTGDRIDETEWTKNIPDAPYQQIWP
jgi:hypothetical protein